MSPPDALAQLPVEMVYTSFHLFEILLGIAILIVIVFIHGAGIRRISRYFSARWVHVTTETPHWRVNLLFGVIVAQLVVVHLVEVIVWAIPIYALNLIPDFSSAAFFAAETYTTLGEGVVRLPQSWRQLGPVIAISGLFTFGWTSSVLVYVMTQFGTLDTSHAQRRKAASADRSPGEHVPPG
ncbi:ion channel [Microvirga antarctica]|uniref:ion channel n=1 Tax=Microvirga antarctica TaxID=2819233 RepID=UPI001FEC9D8F|nr:ion channel [Microvirga antarctica]